MWFPCIHFAFMITFNILTSFLCNSTQNISSSVYIWLVYAHRSQLFSSCLPHTCSVCGGLIGCLSSLIVVFSYRYSASMYGTSFDLLVIRSACDFGLALRFMFEPYIGDKVCGYRTCYYNMFDDFMEQKDKNYCALPAALMEFLEISSEAWFLCLALEFSISLSDPFSTFKQR